jgi:hypothetical protein
MTPINSHHPWHSSFPCWKMSFGPNNTRSKVLKFQCPRFTILQSSQTNPRFGSCPNWFIDVLSKHILLNLWNSTGILFRAFKSALITPWTDHANFHPCLGHCSLISTAFCFPSLFFLLSNFLHRATGGLDMLLIPFCWCPKLDGAYRNHKSCLLIQRMRRGKLQSTPGTSNV